MVFIGLAIHGDNEHGGREHAGAGTEFRVEHLLAEGQRGGRHASLFGPVAGELGEAVTASREVEHGRGIAAERHDGGLAATGGIADLARGADDVVALVGRKVEFHRDGIDLVGQGDDRLGDAVGKGVHVVRLVLEEHGGMTVGLANLKGRLKVVLHAVSDVSLRAGGEVSDVGLAAQTLAEVGLVETAVISDAEDEVSLGGGNTDVLRKGSQLAGNQRQHEEG